MSDMGAAIIGIVVGVVCSVPTSLLLVALLRNRQAHTRGLVIGGDAAGEDAERLLEDGHE